MGTRALWGFTYRGKTYVFYCHFDGYPRGLVGALEHRDPDGQPTPEEQARCAHLCDAGVGAGTPDDWYCLLRRAQGDVLATLGAGVYHYDGTHRPFDIEHRYLFDIDTEVLEHTAFWPSPVTKHYTLGTAKAAFA
jgi:hypothetical protein